MFVCGRVFAELWWPGDFAEELPEESSRLFGVEEYSVSGR